MGAAQLVLAIGVLLAVAGTLGVTWAVFRASSATKTIELYQAESEVQGKINHRLEQEVTRLVTKLDAQTVAFQALQDTVTQRAEVGQLRDELKRSEEQWRVEHQAHTVLLKDILAQLKHQRGAIGR